MSLFSVQLDRLAEKQLKKLSRKPSDYAAISDALVEMEYDPFGGDLRKMQGGDGYRRRVGKYRIVFDVDTDLRLVSVAEITKRADAYRLF